MCSIEGTVTRLRLQLAALGTAAAILIMTAAPLAQALRQTCMLPHHDCETTAKISKCCCDDGAGRSESTPVQERVELRVSGTVIAALPHTGQMAAATGVARPVHTSPPLLCRLDLPTLFASLLI
jgi:hypothetical protein